MEQGLQCANWLALQLSETLIKTVVVGETGTWNMALTLQDMNDASNDLKFLMDGQTFGGSSEPETFSVVVGEADEGSNLFLIIGIVIAALVLLGGVGYFFIEFEDIEEEGFAASEETQEKEDPYAWGRKETLRFLNNNLLLFRYNLLKHSLLLSILDGFGTKRPTSGSPIQTINLPPSE